jgi:uncharacterized membrane protein
MEPDISYDTNIKGRYPMNRIKIKHKSTNFLLITLLLQCVTYLTVFFDVPTVRQIFGFVYFTFLPGFIFVKLLKLDKFEIFETILFSVGFSIAFLMFAGLIVNESLFLFGYPRPLSIWPLMIVLNTLILIGGLLVYIRDRGVEVVKFNVSKTSPLYLLFLALPLLSIVGAMWVNVYGNNIILLLLIISVVSLFAVGVFSRRILPPRFYSLAVILIAIAILYHSSLISKHIVTFGSDIPVEYFAFKLTQNNAHWSSTNPFPGNIGYGRTNAMLSVTILPTIYSTVLNVDSIWIFKALIPFIFSLVPLVLYYTWKGHVGEKYAFISVFLFIAQATFYTEMLALTRQMVAELFFALLFLVILNKKFGSSNKIICFTIFSFALVVSHYALAEIFLIFIFVALISFVVLRRPSRNISVGMVVLFFVVMFAWYIYTSNSSVFDSFLSYGDYVSRQLSDFFNPASRGETVLRGLGLEEPPSVWNMISRIFAYITEALIVIGYFGLVKKRAWRQSGNGEHFMFTSISMAFLAALIIVPGLATTFNMTRFYHVLLFFLAPLCIVGGEELVQFVFRREKELFVSVLLVIVLGAYFLFQTGFVYEVTKSESWSVSLSKNRMDALRLYNDLGYVDVFSVSGAQWMSKNVDYGKSSAYADIVSADNVLRIYGGVFYIDVLSNVTNVAYNGVVYLSALNIASGKMYGMGLSWNYSDLSFIFDDLSLVYDNGQCIVYQKNR